MATHRNGKPLSAARCKRRLAARPLHMETLEERRVLAGGPTLAGITVNDGTLLFDGDVRGIAPTSLVFSFDNGQVINAGTLSNGLRISRSGFDGTFGNGNDVQIDPGFIGLGTSENQVVVRFAESLPDDDYRILLVGEGDTPLTNVDGQPFNMATDLTVDFALNLAPQVVGVVPQPITRVGSVLNQARNQVVVYFNNDDLDPVLAEDPSFYQLIFTGHTNEFDAAFDTVTSTDDGPAILPTNVRYNATTDTATLTFDEDLSAFGVGTYRLRIGTSESVPAPPVRIDPTEDAGSSFATADTSLGDVSNTSAIISGTVTAPASSIVYPGSNFDPGHRRVSTVADQHVPDDGADIVDGVTTQAYNFSDIYAKDQSGNNLRNLITEAQKQRAREAFELWGQHLGIQFVETSNEGFTIATGDLRALDATAITDPDVIQGAAGEIIALDDTGQPFGPTAVLNGAQRWGEDYGGTWFQEAMRLIGSLMGLGGSGDLPPGTIMGSNPELQFGNAPAGVFPGPHDVTHGQFIFRPDGNDIDLYSFTVSTAGNFEAESIAERLQNSSLLDTVLRLYRQDGSRYELIAQNDDYFSQDSYLSLDLQPGTYVLGISSTGNDDYNPVIENTGVGGTTQGAYELRVTMRSAVADSIMDATGVALDGDNNGLPGGVHHFWFRTQTAANTLIVDKAASNAGTGTLTAPYRSITTALAAAAPGNIVRVIGNNFADAVDTNELAYQVGFDSFGAPLPDSGANGLLDVPQGVTVMVDEGAVFKLRRGALVVGSTSPTTDRGGAALQILGTPSHPVVFSSLNDDSVGQNTNPLGAMVRPGDWGGILFRDDFDLSADRFNYEDQGIFLNYVNHADIRYGGGVLSIDSVTGVVNPITMIDVRPTVSFNTIRVSADGAMAASPNAFAETSFNDPEFQSVPFTADYDRVGPAIFGNRLLDNTTNGIYVKNPFSTSPQGDPLLVTAHFDDAEIVHVVSERLKVVGTPGGPTGPDSLNRTARRDAGLLIDPGLIVKFEGAQIEVGIGANFYAEGTTDRPIVFTSLLDDRFGAGGTFDSNNDGGTSQARPGDWAGIYLAATSRGSFDYSVIAYAGGVAPIEGSFTGFNAIEAHQAELRVTRSRLEFNDSGVGGAASATRVGRLANDRGTIYVAGSTPVIVDNTFLDNRAAVIFIDVNDLNYESVVDYGRSTGMLNRINGFADNRGALVRRNVYAGNDLNGMQVRGGTLNTQSIWDDTDIVHILKDGVYVPNFHTYGGLQLKSSVDQSLVIKLLGEDAGFVTTGSSAGIPDHIGGTLQVIGQPGQPVVMTSIFDDTVGAGFDTQGLIQTDTNNGGRPFSGTSDDRFSIDINFGPEVSLFPEVKDAIRKAADAWEEELLDPITIVIDVELADLPGTIMTDASNLDIDNGTVLFQTTADAELINFNTVRSALIADAGAHESIVSQLPTFNQLNFVLPDFTTSEFDVSQNMRLTRANAKALGLSLTQGISSAFDAQQVRDGRIDINRNLEIFDFDRKDGLLTYREDFISQFQRELGELLGFTSGVDTVRAGLALGFTTDVQISPLDLFRFAPGQAEADFTGAPRMLDPRLNNHVFYAGSNPDLDYRSFPMTGLQVGEIPLGTGLARANELNDSYGAAFWQDDLFFRNNQLTVLDPIGIMDPRSRLRDETLYALDPNQSTVGLIHQITEADRAAFDAIGFDVAGGTPGDWQGIRIERLSHDNNVAVVYEKETASSDPTLNGSPATAEFLGQLAPNEKSGDESQRLGFEVFGLVSQASDVDVYSFQAIAGTPIWIDIDRTASSLDSIVELISPDGVVLARSNNSLAEAADPTLLVGIGQPFLNRDTYTTNALDAGMQLVLPGSVGSEGNYHVRVRSNSGNLSSLTGGVTQGSYQMQIRLQAEDEVPGVSIQLADIRYADSGIRIVGPPTRSPLGGEQTESYRLNDAFSESRVLIVDAEGNPANTPPEYVEHESLPNTVEPQFLGNLLASRQGATSVFGKLITDTDVDWYRFQVSYDDLIPTFATSRLEPDRVGLVFDIDYADSLGRPDTTLAVYDSSGSLIYYSDRSNIALDQPGASGQPAAFDLSRGSFGVEDPFIGPVVVEAGRNLTAFDDVFGRFFAGGTYYVAVSSGRLVPDSVADGSASLTPILGDPNRGFQVAGSGLFNTHYDFDPLTPLGGTYTGEYQLELRVVPIPDGGFNSSNASAGDSNRKREQGQITISSNQVSNSREWGIVVEDGLRDFPAYLGDVIDVFVGSSSVGAQTQQEFRSQPYTQFSPGDYVPYPGAARALPNLNEERLLPGMTISNNLISGGREGGINLQGDPNGILLNTYDFTEFGATGMQAFNIDNQKFTIWDHQRKSITFSFNTSTQGDLIIRADTDGTNDTGAHPTTFAQTSGPPSFARTVANEIEHAIRLSDLDVKVYRGAEDSLFIEGAVEIGEPDVLPPDSIWSVFRPDKPTQDIPFPYGHITAEFVQQGGVPYARVVNNTLFGRGGDLLNPNERNGVGDVGILIEDNSSPTLLNNIVSNFAVGIRTDTTSSDANIDRRTFVGGGTIGQDEFLVTTVLSEFFTNNDISLGARLAATGHGLAAGSFAGGGGPLGGLLGLQEEFQTINRNFLDYDTFPTDYVGLRPTVIGGTVYQGNLTNALNAGVGDFALELLNGDPLFVDPANGNFFLASNSRAIDSSIDQLGERSSILEVMNSVGINSLGIRAPSTDVLGILRVDDPSVEPPAGFGRNVFKDRGALERGDFVGPVAELVVPADNSEQDRNPARDEVAVFGESFTSFQVRLSDIARISDPVFGSGADPVTVTADTVTVRRDEVELALDTDYVFTYLATSNTIRITPTAGVWIGGSYEITLDNTLIRDRAENPLQANAPDGTTKLRVVLGEGFDFGDLPDSYGTLLVSDGARHRAGNGSLRLGTDVSLEADGQPSPAANADSFDDGVNFSAVALIQGSLATVPVTVSGSGVLNAWMDFDHDGSFGIDEKIVTGLSLSSTTNPNPVSFLVPQSAVSGLTAARFRLSTQSTLGPKGLAQDGEVEDYLVTVGGSNWQNTAIVEDVSQDGQIAPLDALLVINELSNPVYSDPVTGELPDEVSPPMGGDVVTPLLDVNGDGFVSPLDALLVINQLGTSQRAPNGIVVFGGNRRLDRDEDLFEESVDRIFGMEFDV